ncbi:MAG: aminotransferase class III [Candidatus Yanofskybacteria bacterium RIFCSPHIGHO2_01_FULL_44_17]|uniref:Aminotransferase class III n=1 Tax=Candidatus Yanofskybacteria bacterium RIFCSPHIGHO2_01_FULL_44_17 TaxID=1802668 RepID=A0A1F8EYU8_9BACT|nr:MAG: aminotransferase class III [Candidatus Yanofskybacteria bacterium RIFCSPHIGHO2_01_FULL_44_17]
MSSYQFHLTPQKVPHVKTKFRTIKTKIPAPETLSLIQETKKYGPNLMHGQLPVAWNKAIDFNVFDKAGNKWIDFTSTIFVANAGHANPRIKKAIKDQLDSDLLHSYNYPTEPRVKFLKKLLQMSPSFCEKGLLFSAGTESTEAAIQLMKMYGQHKLKDKARIDIISFQGNMHGITMGAEMMKGNPKILEVYGFSDPHVYRLLFPYPWESGGDKKYDWKARFYKDIENLKKKGMRINKVCGFMIEAYQGWGALFYPKTYIQELEKFAKKNKILITIDEIQGCCGRTGKMFVFEHYGIKPDLLCVGKGLSSSLPLSAVIGRKDILNLPEISGSWHSTHSGNPVCCAAGLANLEEIEARNLVKESARKGKILFGGLDDMKKKYPKLISHIFGSGLLAAILFKHPKTGQPESEFPTRVCELAMQKGLLMVHTGRESIKIAPPLTIHDAALREGLKVLEESIEEIIQEESSYR